jgi:hypothetical protein
MEGAAKLKHNIRVGPWNFSTRPLPSYYYIISTKLLFRIMIVQLSCINQIVVVAHPIEFIISRITDVRSLSSLCTSLTWSQVLGLEKQWMYTIACDISVGCTDMISRFALIWVSLYYSLRELQLSNGGSCEIKP